MTRPRAAERALSRGRPRAASRPSRSAGRRNKVDPSLLAAAPGDDRSFAAFLASLPDVLAARDLRAVIAASPPRRAANAAWSCSSAGTSSRSGWDRWSNAWIARGIVTHVALNGAAAIHDFELAAFGGTSEDVESGLADGSFGMAEETGAEMNAAIAAAARAAGMGEGLAARAGGAELRCPAARRRCCSPRTAHDVPVTVHAAIGAEIIHQHPSADGAALGATSHRDFRRLAGSLPDAGSGWRRAQLGQRGGDAGGLSQGAHHRAQPRRRPPDPLPRRRLRHAAALPAADERGAAADRGRAAPAICSPGHHELLIPLLVLGGAGGAGAAEQASGRAASRRTAEAGRRTWHARLHCVQPARLPGLALTGLPAIISRTRAAVSGATSFRTR